MNDTNIKIEAKMNELLSQKSSVEKLEMGCSMFNFAKILVIASLEKGKSFSEKNLRQQLFLRFYGNDFDELQKNKILKHLGNSI